MRVRRSESGFYGEPGGPDRRATARLRRACGAAHSRPAVDPTETALNPLASLRQGFSPPRSIDTFRVRNLTQNRRKIFHLNCVPRHFVRGQVTNATRWFRDGFTNYAGYIACESICQDPDFTDQQIVRLAHTRQHQRPFSSLSRVGKKLFSWHQYSRRNLSKGYYSAALGLFLVIRQRFGEEAIHDIMIEIGKRDYLDGPDLMEIASDTLNTDIAELVEDFSFPKTGLEMTALTSAIALNKGLGIEEGLLVTKVDPNSPAEQVSIRPDDVIVRVNDKPVRNNLDYELAIFKLMDQQAVELALWRKDEGELVVELALRNGP